MAITSKIQTRLVALVAALNFGALLGMSALLSAGAQAHTGDDIRALTNDGRKVILKVDHSWEFIEFVEGDPSKSAVLTVTKVEEMQDACKLYFHMQNNTGHKIRTLVPRFGVYNQEGVLFDSKSKSFSSIKPTRDMYNSLQFSGIGCHEITRINVHDAARCMMGTIDQWNEEEGECLSYIYITPTDVINISK
jgi:hypothetical protein